jgi:hypothetical protein
MFKYNLNKSRNMLSKVNLFATVLFPLSILHCANKQLNDYILLINVRRLKL